MKKALVCGAGGFIGGHLVKRLKRASAKTRVIVMVTKAQAKTAVKAIAAGAAGVVVKDKTIANLLDALGDATKAKSTLEEAPKRRASDAPRKVLTEREVEVLRHLAEGSTVREVAAILDLSPKTVDAHKTNLMRKLNIHSRLELFRYANRHKLIRPS